jgi:predicted nucleic acid-binding protein
MDKSRGLFGSFAHIGSSTSGGRGRAGAARLQKYVFPEEAQEMIRGLRVEVELVDADTTEAAYSPDPDDNCILAIAIAGQANYVVSGDRADMLVLSEVDGIPIITARQAVDILNLTSQP